MVEHRWGALPWVGLGVVGKVWCAHIVKSKAVCASRGIEKRETREHESIKRTQEHKEDAQEI